MAKVTTKKGIPKIAIIIVAIVIVVIGAGFFLMNNPMVQKGLDVGSGGAFSTIKDALSKSVSLECEYPDPQGTTTKVWIKNGAIRSDMNGTADQGAGSMIMKDKKMYIWNNKEGIVMELDDKKTSGDTSLDSKDTNEAEELIKDLEEYKDKCKPTVVSDSLFTPPSDVEFNDMSKMMEGMTNPNSGVNPYTETPAADEESDY